MRIKLDFITLVELTQLHLSNTSFWGTTTWSSNNQFYRMMVRWIASTPTSNKQKKIVVKYLMVIKL